MTQTSPLKVTYDEAQLQACIDDGMSARDMAKEFGVSIGAMRSALTRRSLYPTKEIEQSLRSKVQAMKPLDAVEYLLGVVEMLSLVKPKDDHPVDIDWPELTPLQRRLAIALYDHMGQTVSREALYEALYFDKWDAPEPSTLNVFVCQTRAKTPPGHRIITDRGVGFRMERHGALFFHSQRQKPSSGMDTTHGAKAPV